MAAVFGEMGGSLGVSGGLVAMRAERWAGPACLYVVLAGLFALVEHWLWGKGWEAALWSSLVLAAVWVPLNYRAELRRAWRGQRVLDGRQVPGDRRGGR
jgi:hypothetical protein